MTQALHEGRIIHGNNDLLAWSACNVVLRYDVSGLYCMPSKARSHSRDKIDPIVAVTMALSEAMYAERIESNYYERGGAIEIE